MDVNFNSPASIKAWLDIAPERHLPQLRALWRLQPQFRDAIQAAAPAKPKRQKASPPPAPTAAQASLL